MAKTTDINNFDPAVKAYRDLVLNGTLSKEKRIASDRFALDMKEAQMQEVSDNDIRKENALPEEPIEKTPETAAKKSGTSVKRFAGFWKKKEK